MFTCVILATLLHGGQYLPPLPDPLAETESVIQPGTGPTVEFHAGRWEWWFDFNQEVVLQLRKRMRERGADTQGGFDPVTASDRSRTVLPVLVDAMRSGNRNVRGAAAMALAHLATSEVVPYLEVMAEDGDLFVRTHAIVALGVTGQSSAAEPLGEILRDRSQSAEVRTFAAAGLGLLGSPEAADVLRAFLSEKALTNEKNVLRAGLVYAAGLTGDPQLAGTLAELLGTWLLKNDAGLRALVAVAQGQIGDPQGIPILLGLLADNDNQVRRSAATGLQAVADQLTPDQVAQLIDRYATESDLPVRFNMLRTLGAVRSDATRAFLQRSLADGTSLIRPHAALALALDGDPGNIAPLRAALEDQHEISGRSALVLALGLLEAQEAVDDVVAILERVREPSHAGYASLAAGLLAPDREELVERLESLARTGHDVELVRLSTIALGLAGEREALTRLVSDLEDAQGSLDRAARLHAVGWVGDRHQIEPLIAVVQDDSQTSYVTTYAVQALGEICDPRDVSPASRLSSFVELNHNVGFLFELYTLQ